MSTSLSRYPRPCRQSPKGPESVFKVYYWSKEEPLCDIGPMSWGDGVVDVEDLIVLAEHFFGDIPPRKMETKASLERLRDLYMDDEARYFLGEAERLIVGKK